MRRAQLAWLGAVTLSVVTYAGAARADAPAAADTEPEAAVPAGEGAVEGEEEIEEIEEAGPLVVSAPDAWRASDWPQADRAVNVLTPTPTRAGALLMVIDHRTWQAFSDDPVDDFLGFDSGGLKIGLALRYGVLEDLDVGALRLNNGVEAFDVYELDARWRALSQEEHAVDLALRLGGTWFAQERAEDASGTFAQLAVARRFGPHLSLGAGLAFHSEATGDRKRDVDEAWALAVPAWAEVRFTPSVAWRLEAVFNVAGYGAEWPALSTSVAFMTHRHSFSFVVSNTQYTSADGLVSNSWRGLEDLIIGFSITRELQL